MAVVIQKQAAMELLELFKTKIETGEWDFVQANYVRPSRPFDNGDDSDWLEHKDTGVRLMTFVALSDDLTDGFDAIKDHEEQWTDIKHELDKP